MTVNFVNPYNLLSRRTMIGSFFLFNFFCYLIQRGGGKSRTPGPLSGRRLSTREFPSPRPRDEHWNTPLIVSEDAEILYDLGLSGGRTVKNVRGTPDRADFRILGTLFSDPIIPSTMTTGGITDAKKKKKPSFLTRNKFVVEFSARNRFP